MERNHKHSVYLLHLEKTTNLRKYSSYKKRIYITNWYSFGSLEVCFFIANDEYKKLKIICLLLNEGRKSFLQFSFFAIKKTLPGTK